MNHQTLFEQFDTAGKLLLSGREIPFRGIPWTKHPAFEGVELKHIVPAQETGGQFSFHLVRIAPNRTIGIHIHETQLETHEVICGGGVCVLEGAELLYEPGVVAILPAGLPHEVRAGDEGLCLFAKFMPALS